ncbi:MAG: heavy-metal-associated domain-containing protein [Acidobacteria bacterium]|jgi:copper chaperone|nr:heavy-metal-associated domain-containing protein [Acidobacteriota bacterium]
MNDTTNKTTNKTTTVTAPDIVCGGCASSIKKALGNLSGVAQVDVDVATKTVKVEHSEAASRDEIIAALDRAGFSVQ